MNLDFLKVKELRIQPLAPVYPVEVRFNTPLEAEGFDRSSVFAGEISMCRMYEQSGRPLYPKRKHPTRDIELRHEYSRIELFAKWVYAASEAHARHLKQLLEQVKAAADEESSRAYQEDFDAGNIY